MQLKILQIGDPILRQVARPLTRTEIRSKYIQQLISDMRTTMNEAPGVGLAAPQIGESLQLILIEDKAEYHKNLTDQQLTERERKPIPFHVLINPKIKLETEEQKDFFEGCLSIAGFVGITSRTSTVTVEALNQKAELITIKAQGWYARILQHEIDHLNGKLCVDHYHPLSLITISNYMNFWHDKSITEFKQQLSK